jgi:hypothetical protein
MVFYDDNVSLIENTIVINSYVEFITTLFNYKTQEALYIIAIYRSPKMQVSNFNYILENIIQKMPSHCLNVIIGNFNINFLTKRIQSSIL